MAKTSNFLNAAIIRCCKNKLSNGKRLVQVKCRTLEVLMANQTSNLVNVDKTSALFLVIKYIKVICMPHMLNNLTFQLQLKFERFLAKLKFPNGLCQLRSQPTSHPSWHYLRCNLRRRNQSHFHYICFVKFCTWHLKSFYLSTRELLMVKFSVTDRC